MGKHPASDIVKWFNKGNYVRCNYDVNETIPSIRGIFQKTANNKGLLVEINRKRTYFYKNEMLVGGLVGYRSSSISPGTVRICRQKQQTFKALKSKGIPVPEGKVFDRTEFNKAQRWVRKLGKDVVVKPASFEGGKGVTVKVDISFFSDAWEHCLETLEKYNKKDMGIIIETYHPGVDIRAIVIDDRFICAASRLPANVIGDGQNDICSLVELKNREKSKNPFLKNRLIRFNSYKEKLLYRQGFSLEYVPKKDEVVLLDEVSNLSRGGDLADVTDIVCDDLKSLAIRAAKTFPDLDYAGVDIITPGLDSVEKSVVNEVNNYNNIMMHYYPVFGSPRDPASSLIKHFLNKYEKLSNHPLDDLLIDANKAIEQNNNTEAIILLHHALNYYKKPPVKLYVKLARLYVEDNYSTKAKVFLEKASAHCQDEEMISVIQDVVDVVAMQAGLQERIGKLKDRLRVGDKRLKRAKNRIARMKSQTTRLKQRNKDLGVKVKELNRIKRSHFWRYYKGFKKIARLFIPSRRARKNQDQDL